MINFNMGQFRALLSKELKEAFRDRRAMLSDVSAMMMRSRRNRIAFLDEGAAI